jgi:hypothetical protein
LKWYSNSVNKESKKGGFLNCNPCTSSPLTFKPNEMCNACPDDFDEPEPMDEELLDAFDVIDTAASSHPTAISQCSALTAPCSAD